MQIFGEEVIVARTDLPFPSKCILAGIIRRGRLVIPHADTVLQSDDELLAVVSTRHKPVDLASILGA